MKATVEPLPLVPATWITGGSLRSGWPSAASMRSMRSSDRSMRLGCSAISRATMESMAVMQSGCHHRAVPKARDPATPINLAWLCVPERDGRYKPWP